MQHSHSQRLGEEEKEGERDSKTHRDSHTHKLSLPEDTLPCHYVKILHSLCSWCNFSDKRQIAPHSTHSSNSVSLSNFHRSKIAIGLDLKKPTNKHSVVNRLHVFFLD